jgi:hypothetical protein
MQKSPVRKFPMFGFFIFMILGLSEIARADFEYSVSATKSLKVVANEIQSKIDPGIYRVKFSTYGKNVDQFKMDSPTAQVDSIIFERNVDMESDSVIKVDSTLFDFRRMKGTVVLRGLAFQLANPKAVLISGSEVGKENLHLLIDECFIFADSLDGTFLNWAGLPNSNIEIRRSFIISRTGTVLSKLSVSGGNILLKNNLFNFPGFIAGSVSKFVEIKANTFNRTQLRLTGDVVSTPPTYSFTRNLVAHHGATAAFHATQFWFGYFSAFLDADAIVQNNRIYNAWNGFDLGGSTKFAQNNSNQFIDSLPFKSSRELWNWYSSLDSMAGFSYGLPLTTQKYNVFPDSTQSDFNLQGLAAKVYFKPAKFPKIIKAEYDPAIPAPLVANPDLRFWNPTSGPLHFGSFRVDSISLPVNTQHGIPILLTKDSNKVFTRQAYRDVQRLQSKSIFSNGLASGRFYFFSHLGNTASGSNITPTSEIGNGDVFTFTKVDSAGFTSFFHEPSCSVCPKEYRYLEKDINIKTTAVIKDSLVFGLRDSLVAYRADSTYWMISGSSNRFMRAVRASGVGGKFVATALAESPFKAYLVEKLSVPKGGTTFPLVGGSLQAKSENGYQITILDTTPSDTIHYGQNTRAYGFKEVGRLATDSVKLQLKWKPDQEAFKDSLGKILPLGILPDTAGIVKLDLGKKDAGLTYFLAVKFNIFKDSLYTGSIEGGVTLGKFRSSVSAKAKFADLDTAIKNYSWTNQDSAFASTLFLAGKEFRANGALPIQPWEMTFPVIGSHDRSKVEAWWSDGKDWTKIASPDLLFLTVAGNDLKVSKLPIQARYIVAVERLQPPETYVIATPPTLKDNIFRITVNYVGDSLNKAINQYKVELKSVDQLGDIVKVDSPAVDVGTPFEIILKPNLAYVYRIQYLTGTIPYGSPSFQALEGPAWDRKVLLAPERSLHAKDIWHIVGFPFSGTLKHAIVKNGVPLDTAKFIDTLKVMDILKTGTSSEISALKDWQSLSFTPGKGYLVGGTRAFDLKMADQAQFLPLKPYKIGLDSGWYFMANPFPTSFLSSKIKTQKKKNLFFWDLVATTGAAGTTYAWAPAKTLKAFTGYAYQAVSKDTLVFDLLGDVVPTTPLAKSSLMPGLTEVKLYRPSATANMFITSNPNDESIPFLSTPNSSLELRLGGGSGFLLKSIANGLAMDEPLEIRSLQSGMAAFSVASPEVEGLNEKIQVRLVDLVTGKVYDEVDAKELPLTSGTHPYRLLAGTTAFVSQSIDAFRATLPQSIGLSQNFPNPVRGLTRISLLWPAIQSEERHAVLQVLDTRGREVHRVNLDKIQAGRQVLTLDVSRWNPGIYLYRLTVSDGARKTRLQKRMLVSP